MLRRALFVLLAFLLTLPVAAAVPFWGARNSSPVDTLPAQLKPGQWIWGGDNKAMGPIAVIVSLTEQRAYAYRNGILIGVTTISSGKPGHETPTGVFTILQKDKDHHSSKYNSAPMPYQQRLTWDGVALHAGGLPGYPESHGCVHLPSEFARLLFDASNMGMTVVVAEEGSAPAPVVHPGAVIPVDPVSGASTAILPLADGQPYNWHPERATSGPVSMVLSRSDHTLLVMRNGVEIGRSSVLLRNPQEQKTGTRAYIVGTGYVPAGAADSPAGQMPSWMVIGVPGHDEDAGKPLDAATIDNVVLPDGFTKELLPLLVPGTVLLATDEGVLPETTGRMQRVLDAEPPAR